MLDCQSRTLVQAGRIGVPTYEYKCDTCRRRYELREGFDAPTSHACERCDDGTAVRVLHAPTVVFKGSGFYVNDSRKSEKSTSSSEKTTSLPSGDSAKSGSGGTSATSSKNTSKG
ncbi:MAG: FmdB family transcriptional regulator [Dehalococcoidia bacterium]|nr:FmdB family transcriptional regulator [Dehalococcoidia bacterium]MYI85292.1 FmdB family transcriptional regulator [Dehalococcoidia bacterium]